MRERPATMLTKDDGVNGKQSSKKSGPKPRLSTQPVNVSTFGFLFKKDRNLFCPNLRTSKNTKYAPADAPSQEYKKPSQSPKALALAITIKTNGRKGNKASIIGNIIPGSGPNDRYCSIKCKIFSKVNQSLSSSAVIKILLRNDVAFKKPVFKKSCY